MDVIILLHIYAYILVTCSKWQTRLNELSAYRQCGWNHCIEWSGAGIHSNVVESFYFHCFVLTWKKDMIHFHISITVWKEFHRHSEHKRTLSLPVRNLSPRCCIEHGVNQFLCHVFPVLEYMLSSSINFSRNMYACQWTYSELKRYNAQTVPRMAVLSGGGRTVLPGWRSSVCRTLNWQLMCF
jgi:hypothetical protein